ncbi:MAG: ribonuclease III family protein [Promethearchaeati archaeon]
MEFGFLVENIPKTKKAIGTDKGLAKIGDGIVNFTYSLAKSIYLSKKLSGKKIIRTGEKVSKNILSKALKDAEMKSFAKNRADSHDLANTVEAVIAYVWLKRDISIEEIVIILLNNLSGNISHRIREVDNAAKAFTRLLLEIKKYLPEKEL